MGLRAVHQYVMTLESIERAHARVGYLKSDPGVSGA
jgi:hypothetical protein